MVGDLLHATATTATAMASAPRARPRPPSSIGERAVIAMVEDGTSVDPGRLRRNACFTPGR